MVESDKRRLLIGLAAAAGALIGVALVYRWVMSDNEDEETPKEGNLEKLQKDLEDADLLEVKKNA